MYRTLQILFLFFIMLFLSSVLLAQKGINKKEKVLSEKTTNQTIEAVQKDTLPKNEVIEPPTPNLKTSSLNQINLSKDTLNAKIEYNADFQRLDNVNKRVLLVGNGSVKYQTLSITADSIIFDWGKNEVIATGRRDSLGQLAGIPQFTDKEESFTANKIRYNFKTQKGIIYDVTTQENDLFVHSGRVRYEANAIKKDTSGHDVAYSADALITTCDHEHPHFGIRSKKIKVIPNKLVVVGPSSLEIAGIKLPVGLPFGFFPITKGQRSGVLFPRDYEFSEALGFGLSGIGYYFALGEYYDLSITGDIFTRGTWRLGVASQYKKRYKFRGNLNIRYSHNVTEDVNTGIESAQKSFAVIWSHNQDRSAHPSQNFSGGINFQTNDDRSRNFNDANSVLNTQLSSNLNYNRTFPGKPYNLSASLTHSQNTRTRDVTISFPKINFNMNRVTPFKRKIRKDGKERWYEKIGIDYRFEGLARVNAKDSVLFTQETLENLQYGTQHSTNIDANFKLFKYFNVRPNARYSEKWFFKTLKRSFDTTPVVDTITTTSPDGTEEIVTYDTLSYGTQSEDFVNGFQPLREFSAGISVNTQIFGTMKFKKGFIRGVRHVIRPTFSLNYTPDYTNDSWGYFDYVDTDSRAEENNPQRYSIFQNGIYSGPSSAGKSMALTYSFANLFEAKYFSKKDTINSIKKIKLIDNLGIGGSYNFAADSLNFSPIRVNTAIRLFKNISTVSFNATFDPYASNEVNGRHQRTNTFMWEKERKLLRFDNFTTTVRTGFTLARIKEMLGFKNNDRKSDSRQSRGQQRDNETAFGRSSGQNPLGGREERNSGVDDNGASDLFSDFNISHNIVFRRSIRDGKGVTEITTNNIAMRGTLNLSEKWKLTVGNISYDFKSQRLVYPDLSFYRDLHCWEMGMNWQPERGTYAFFIRVKPSSLDFLNIPYNKNNFDTNFGR